MSRDATYLGSGGYRPSKEDGGTGTTPKNDGALFIKTPAMHSEREPEQPKKQKQQQPKPKQPKEEYDKFLLYKKLPYVRRKMDFGSWLYYHRYGVTVTVMTYVVAMFIFSSMRFDITTTELVQGFFVDLPPEPKEPEVKEPEQKKPELTEEQMMQDVQNIAVDENAKLDGGLMDDQGTKASDIYKEAQEMQNRLNASRQAYDQGISEDEAYINDMRQSLQQKGQNKTKREASKVSGNVTISWSLAGREAVYIHNPAYRCPGAGSVTIAITVNRNGNVIAAEVDKISRSDDNCLIDMAIEAAQKTTFNVSSSAPEKQKGTVTYIFMAQ